MSTDRDVTRIVRSWLEEGRTALPDRVLDAVLDQLPATPQRRASWPVRRLLQMNMPARVATAAAAVVTIAVIGAIAWPRGGRVAAQPTASPSASPTPTPIAFPLNPQELTVTVPGTYLVGDGFQVPTTLKVPAGWVVKVGGPYAAYLDRAPVGTGGAGISLTLSQKLYADPCHARGFLSPQPGSTVDDLAAAVAKLPGFEVTTPTAVIIDGYGGKELTLTAPASFDGCTLNSDGYALWQLPLGAIQSFQPSQSTILRIVDAGGKRLIVSSDTYPSTTTQGRAEIQGILDSIRFVKNG